MKSKKEGDPWGGILDVNLNIKMPFVMRWISKVRALRVKQHEKRGRAQECEGKGWKKKTSTGKKSRSGEKVTGSNTEQYIHQEIPVQVNKIEREMA
jgi:hypothetical protein